jgi:hypothetical protein
MVAIKSVVYIRHVFGDVRHFFFFGDWESCWEYYDFMALLFF